MDPRMMAEMQKREAMKRKSKVAQSQASATPIQPTQAAPPPGMAGGGQNPLQQAGMQIGKQLLGSALGPLGGIIGGLFNEGGKVPMAGYNEGGWLKSLWGGNKEKKRPSKQLPAGYTPSGSKRYSSSSAGHKIMRGDNTAQVHRLNRDRQNAFQNRNQTAWNNLKTGLGFNEGGQIKNPYYSAATGALKARRGAGQTYGASNVAAATRGHAPQAPLAQQQQQKKGAGFFFDGLGQHVPNFFKGVSLNRNEGGAVPQSNQANNDPYAAPGSTQESAQAAVALVEQFGLNGTDAIFHAADVLAQNQDPSTITKEQILAAAGGVQNKNMGGPISANPMGYNEGGQTMETPMKRVMDEQKLEQQAVAFDKDEMRKQEKHTLDMKLKQQQFQQAQQMKKQAASTNKTAKAPLSK